MAEPKVNTSGGTMIASSGDAAPTGGGGTMIASAAPPKPERKAPPQPPPKAPPRGTMVAAGPPPSVAAAPVAVKDDFGSGGTMMASVDAVPAAVAELPLNDNGSNDLTGQTLLGRYEIIKKLGEGGMGTVYLGEHKTIKKKLAIKVLSQEFAHKKDLKDRFLQEARAASMISQENVVEINDFGDTPDGSSFFVMEFLAGEDLSDTVKKQGKLPWVRVKAIMLQICRALGAAHEAGIIHRDMKPENCYRITRGKNEDFIKVLDFGIAKVTTEEEGGKEGKGLTKTGMIFGTPEYMSPEQAQGSKPDHRVDVYAVGVIMYELLTGKVPFHADTFMGILTKHMFEVPQAPSAVAPDADIPVEVEAIILKALQKDRDLRFQNMAEMAEAIERVGTGAAAVAVVNENIARPTQGEMVFTGGRPTPVPGTMPPIAVGYEEPHKSSNRGLMFGLIGGLALAAAGVGAFFAFKDDKKGDKQEVADKGEKTEDPATVAGKPEVAEPNPTPPEPEKVKEIAQGVATVMYTITTKDPEGNPIEAKILDPRDNAIYGKTNGATGVEVEKQATEMELVLRADGFEDMAIKIIPDRSKQFEFVLTPVKKKSSGGTTKKPNNTSKTEPEKTVDPKPADTKGGKSDAKTDGPPRRVTSDLKDPFGRGKSG
ncbi:serine/threonine protein kinase [Nannocystaceae bacterium ST9]